MQRVRTGIYQAGAPLPSVRAISEEFGVSLNVVQRAVRHLEESGIVSTHHGKGMMVAEAEACRRAAILFGFIQPYTAGLVFESMVFHYAGQVFNNRDNFLVTRSSEGSAEQEREVATHFINNGVKGILLWSIEGNPNAKFFKEVSQRVPVVLVDRLLEGSDLPAVIYDSYESGRSIGRHMLQTLGRKRMLVLMDNIKVSPYHDLIQGFHDEAVSLGKMSDLTIMQLPITRGFLEKITKSFAREVDTYKPYIERLLTEGGYDALFCPQGEFVDYVMIETGLYKNFKNLTLGVMCGTESDPNLTKLAELGVLQWVVDHPRIISQGANLLQQWVLTRKPPQGVIKISVALKERG